MRASVAAILALGLTLAARGEASTWPNAAQHLERDLASPDVAVRRAAAEGLRTLAPVVATPLLIRALGDADPDVKVAAAHAAIAKSATEATHAVLAWLGERDPRLRIAACEVLGRLHDPAGPSQLARALGDSEPSVRTAAATALGEQETKDASQPLLGKLDDPSPAVRIAVVSALAHLGDARAVVPLVGKAQDSVPEVRQAVARALGDLGDPRASPALVLELRDGSNDVRAAALAALGQLRADKAADAIAALAIDRNPLLRRAAVEALGQIGSAEAVRALLGLLGGADDAAAGLESSPPREALASTGARAAPALRALLSGPATPSAATSAAWVLGEIRATEAIPDIVRAMRRGTLPTSAALRALAAMGSDEGAPVVLEFVADPNPAVRREALRAAERLLRPETPDGRAVEPLAAALRDARLTSSERALAVTLLGQTRAARAAPAIESLVTARDPELRLAAIDALGAIGPTGRDATLLAQLDDADAAVRLHAAVALGFAGGVAARDALVARIDPGSGAPARAAVDRCATLAALGGILARLPTVGAVTAVRAALDLAPGPDRDALILALGRADIPAALPGLRDLAASPSPDDRRALATVLAARRASPAGELLLGLLSDPDPGVRAEAAWSLGESGDASAIPVLRGLLAGPDPAPAVDAAAAIARILARSRTPEQAKAELCPLLVDARADVRANALGGLALTGVRCGDGGAERRLLEADVAPVRAAAASAITGHLAGAEDLRALSRCRAVDASGAVARRCRAGHRPVSSGAVDPVEIYVEGDAGAAPEPGAPYVLELADGLLRAGRCDRRGAVFDPAAPRGDVSLLGAVAPR